MKMKILAYKSNTARLIAWACLVFAIGLQTSSAQGQNFGGPITFPASLGPFTLQMGNRIAASGASSTPFIPLNPRDAADLCRVEISWSIAEAGTRQTLAETTERLDPEDAPASIEYINRGRTPIAAIVNLEVIPTPNGATALSAIRGTCNFHGSLSLTTESGAVQAAIAIPNLLDARKSGNESSAVGPL